MPNVMPNCRARGKNGKFISPPTSTRSTDSLVRQRRCQKTYIARQLRVRKLVLNTFAKAFIVKDAGQNHWLPGSMIDNVFFDCMERLVKHTCLQSRKSRLSMMRKVFYKGNPKASGKRLPKIHVPIADPPIADPPIADSKPISAFVAWRFPFTDDLIEMEGVNRWLETNKMKLRLSVEEAKLTCYQLFNTYTQVSGKYFYIGYPPRTVAPIDSPDNGRINDENRQALADVNPERAPMDLNPHTNRDGMAVAGTSKGEESMEHSLLAAMLSSRNDVITMAKSDYFYLLLKEVLRPEENALLPLACDLSMHTVACKEHCQNYVGLEKDVLEYSVLKQKKQTSSAKFIHLKQNFEIHFDTFKTIRKAVKLPLYEDDEDDYLKELDL